MTMPGYSPCANPYDYGQIDAPLRFGPNSFWTANPGQSFARIDLYNVALGVSRENLWWGPGVRNALLMSNSGPDSRTHSWELRIRRTSESAGWRRRSSGDGFPSLRTSWTIQSRTRRLFTALTLGYEQRWIRGLFVGLTRVFLDVIPPGGLPVEDYFIRLFWAPREGHNEHENQLGSIPLGLSGELGRDLRGARP
jgi:hypothetical protein